MHYHLLPLIALLSLPCVPLSAPAPTVVVVQGEGSERNQSIAPLGRSITPITSLSASCPTQLGGSCTTAGALQTTRASSIDLTAWTSSSTATITLVLWDTTAGRWVKYGPDCTVTTAANVCRVVARHGPLYWHVYKSAGTLAATYIEQVERGPIAMSIESSAAGLASVTADAPLTGDGTSGSHLALSIDSSLTLVGGALSVAAHAASHRAGGSDALLSAPGAIGGGTAAAGTFTVLTANTRVDTPSVGTSSSAQHALPSGTDAVCTVDATQTLTAKTLTNPTINAGSGVVVLPGASSPAQTAEGSATWDTDDDVLTIGTGAGRKTLVNTDSSLLGDYRHMKTTSVSNNTYFGQGVTSSATARSVREVRVFGAGTVNFVSLVTQSTTVNGSVTVSVYKSTDNGVNWSLVSGATRTITTSSSSGTQIDNTAQSDFSVADGDWLLVRTSGYTGTTDGLSAVLRSSGGARLALRLEAANDNAHADRMAA